MSETGSREVIVLGAGFSIAVSEYLPSTDQLGEAVRQRLTPEDRARLPAGPFQDGRFEEWLSYLAEPQPHLRPDKLLEAEALLLRTVGALKEELSEIQLAALAHPAPPWLCGLLSMFHFSKATILTMNYDNLVECGVASGWLKVGGTGGIDPVTEDHVLERIPPPLAQTYASLSGLPAPQAQTFRLLKLHGSLSWYWVPGDLTGTSFRRWGLPGTFGSPLADDEIGRRQQLPGHEPFIVPPAAVKSTYLGNPLVRELWGRAFDALRTASRVVLMGYSLPAGDRAVTGMVADALVGRPVTLEVVNLCPETIVERLVRLGIPSESIESLGGEDCIVQWTDREVERASRSLVDRLQESSFTGSELLYVVLPNMEGVVRVSTEMDSGDVILEVDPPGEVAVQPIPMKDLLERLSKGKRVFAEGGDWRWPVVAVERIAQPNVATLDQLVFFTTGC